MARAMARSMLAYLRVVLEARGADVEELAKLDRLGRKGTRLTLTDIAVLAADEGLRLYIRLEKP